MGLQEERQMKANILRKEFLEADVNHLEYLSKNRLFGILDLKVKHSMSNQHREQELEWDNISFFMNNFVNSVILFQIQMGKQFDREVGDQLFERMNKDYSG